MSGMSNMLRIALYRDAPSRHEPKWKRGTAARDATVPKGCSPFIQLVARGVMGGMEECPGCLSCRSCGRPLGSGCVRSDDCLSRPKNNALVFGSATRRRPGGRAHQWLRSQSASSS